MANTLYPDQHISRSTIRADQPTPVEIGPEARDAMVVIVGAVFAALVASGLANYLMLPFGAG
ncbi:hypothetical protein ACSTJV_24240 [Vibrio parahaemolyticus]|jgi:hypothetical protein